MFSASIRFIPASEQSYSPFYTYLTGTDATPAMEAIPSYKPKSWKESPPVCRSVMDTMNKIAGRMIEGEKPFNSLLLCTMPANLGMNYVPVSLRRALLG